MARGKTSGGAIGRNIGLLIIFVPLLFIFLPTVLFLAIAMLPTFVAVVIDKGPKRYGGMTVGGLNFAGAAPYLLDLWTMDHSVPHALTLLSDIFALILIFGSSAFGWMLFAGTPSVVAAVAAMTSSRRLATLKSRQKELLEEWGPEVRGEPDDGVDIGAATAKPK
jgi:hypothetical protein